MSTHQQVSLEILSMSLRVVHMTKYWSIILPVSLTTMPHLLATPMRWLSESVKFRCVILVGVPSAFLARPRLGIACASRVSRSGGSTPARSAASIALSRAALALAAAVSAFLSSSARSAGGASASLAASAYLIVAGQKLPGRRQSRRPSMPA